MGLLSVYIDNVQNMRNAKLAFSIDQREQREALARQMKAEQDRAWQSLSNSDFQQQLALALSPNSGGVYQSPNPPPRFSEYPPQAPEPPAQQRYSQSPPPSGLPVNPLVAALSRMRETTQRMGGGGLLRTAASPNSQAR